MSDHPVYQSSDEDIRTLGIKRPCAAPADVEGTCEEVAQRLGVRGTWLETYWGSYGWVCGAHERAMTEKYHPERIEAMHRQLAAEGAAFWANYGIEASETPRLTAEQQERDALNSDT